MEKVLLTERDLHVLQTEVVESDHAHEDKRQRKHLDDLLRLAIHNRKVIQDRLRAICACYFAQMTQHDTYYAGQQALIPVR